MIGRPADYRAVIHPDCMKTAVYVAAGRPPCIELHAQASTPTGRDYRATRLGDLDSIRPKGRWVLAVILCPGDTTLELVAWMHGARADPERVVFFLHPETDAVTALHAWYEAGYSDPVAHEAKTWRQLASPLGRFVNDWIYADAKGTGWPL